MIPQNHPLDSLKTQEKEEDSNVIDLMDALKQSLDRKKAAAPKKGKKRSPAPRSRKRKAA